MQKIRKILRYVSEKTTLPNNHSTNQPIITSNIDVIGPRWRQSKMKNQIAQFYWDVNFTNNVLQLATKNIT